MKCEETRKYINLFIDSELDTKTSFEIAEHLSSCEACDKRFTQEEKIEKTIVSVLKGHKEPKAEETWERVLLRFKGQREFKRKRRPCIRLYKRYVVPVAAAIGIVAILFIFYSSQGTSELIAATHKCHREYMVKEISPSIVSVFPDEITRYFSGKFSFPSVISEIPDFQSHHIKLSGGKVCHLSGISTAYTMYRCCEKPVSVFLMSKKDAEYFSDTMQSLKGGNIVSIKKDGLNFVMARSVRDTFVCVVADHDREVLEWIARNFIKT